MTSTQKTERPRGESALLTGTSTDVGVTIDKHGGQNNHWVGTWTTAPVPLDGIAVKTGNLGQSERVRVDGGGSIGLARERNRGLYSLPGNL
jgi:hypothetical protein